ncbi:MAG TPA: hypothetical protein PKM50_00435 [Methanoregula sp.]|nr:hypothetical protein [Methanoregula sp.]
MNTERCNDITDEKRIEQKSGLAEPGILCRDYGFLILAGIMIGLGAGLLADNLFAGFLIGLGSGLVVSELLPLARKSPEGVCQKPAGMNVTALLIGAFLILAGTSIVFAPAAIWLYVFAGFFILAGIWILVRGFSAIS